MQEKQQPLVSILISAYNAEHFLLLTINSILVQTYTNIEVLILDDKSQDNTYGLHTKISDPRVRWFKGEISRWPYGWLNFLLDQVKGAYIAIQDHDDLWHPTKIEKQIEFLEYHQEYRWCGTKTLMRYESDQQGFLYYLWEKNYYTIHPSLVFRAWDERYPLDTTYMTDAYFQKMQLCKWGEKLIYNLDETLSFHLIRSGAKNFSYKRFSYSRATFRVIFQLHPLWYWICIIGWETLRKLLYPVFRFIGKGHWIDVMERKPFEILGNRMSEYSQERLRGMGFEKN